MRVLILVVVLGLTGCTSKSYLRRQISILTEENRVLHMELDAAVSQPIASEIVEDENCSELAALEQARLVESQRTQCMLLHQDAKTTCELLYREESNALLFHQQMVQCLAKRGFPQGLRHCE